MEGKGLISSILHTSPRRQARHESRLRRCHISQAETSWSSLRVPKRSTRNRDPWREGRGRPCPITLFSGMDTDSLPDRRGHTSSCRRWWPTSAFRPGARRGHSTPPRPRSGLPPPGRLQRLLPALMALAPRPAQSSPQAHTGQAPHQVMVRVETPVPVLGGRAHRARPHIVTERESGLCAGATAALFPGSPSPPGPELPHGVAGCDGAVCTRPPWRAP